MKTYTLKETAKKINVTPGILRKWEKDFEELFEIPRSKQGARIFTDYEIEILLEIKQMYDKKLSKDMIKAWMQDKSDPENEDVSEALDVSQQITNCKVVSEPPKVSIEVIKSEDVPESPEVSLEVISEPVKPVTIQDAIDAHLLFEALDNYKQNFLSEVKDEIRSVVRKEVVEEVKKEITNGTYYTVKSLSNSI
ncbi:MAG: MerR family transcriptional regulator, partial [Bacillus sp. (in: firmicutes)]